jgi:glycosyltransferase involved in cell wall biosynthesis
MIKARTFFLIAFTVFFTLFVIKIIEKGYTYKSISKNLPFQINLNSVEKPICVIIPSYNNQEYVERNLTSVLEQDYKNFNVIYIDDFSSDETVEKAKEIISSYHLEDKVTLIRNEENHKALYNLYYTIQSLPDDVICYVLDGDDWLLHKSVLKDLNRFYKNEEVWASYSQYVTYPKYEKGNFIPVSLNKKNLRSIKDIPSLRSFYAGLFKKIKMKDLIFEGEFMKTSSDKSISYPIWEMAREHVLFIPDVEYVYNRQSPLNDDKVRKEKQRALNRYVTSLDSYPRISSYKNNEIQDLKTAVIVFSENRPLQLLSFLESFNENENQFNSIHVFYSATELEIDNGYNQLKNQFEQKVHFHKWLGQDDFDAKLSSIESSYIIFAKDTVAVSRPIELNKSIEYLEKTGAYALYFDLGLNLKELPSKILPVGDGYFIWDFANAPMDWKLANRIDLTLYRKSTVFQFLKKMHYKTIQEFESGWKKCRQLREVGLFFKESKSVNIFYQITKLDSFEKIYLYSPKELNQRLLDGYKIDTKDFKAILNSSNQIEFYPRFIENH